MAGNPNEPEAEVARARVPARESLANLVLMVMDGFGETDPDVEQAQAAAHAAAESVGEKSAYAGLAQQEGIVGPLLGPGQHDQQDAGRGADKDKQQHQQAVHPSPAGGGERGNRGGFGVEVRGRRGFGRGRRSQTRRSGKAGARRSGGIAHQAGPRRSGDETLARGGVIRSKSIRVFYDFRALMRSPTSR